MDASDTTTGVVPPTLPIAAVATPAAAAAAAAGGGGGGAAAGPAATTTEAASAAAGATTPAVSLVRPGGGVKARASSTLQRNTKLYGAANAVDGDRDTCWNSDPGRPQWIEVTLPAAATVTRLVLSFQGGFVGVGGQVAVSAGAGAPLVPVAAIEPDDAGGEQAFAIVPPAVGVTTLRVSFANSTDFYGRVTLYSLDVIGHWLASP